MTASCDVQPIVLAVLLLVSWAPLGLLLYERNSAPRLVHLGATHLDQLVLGRFARNQSVTPVATSNQVFTTFSSVALRLTPVTDKVTVHHYQTLYDVYFSPEVQAQAGFRLLEIGLGCDMHYGPGASAQIWPILLPRATIWFADSDTACVARYSKKSFAWKVVTGDQADLAVLKKWVNETGGDFDFIIDDGGHLNSQIWASFQHLFFHGLKSGGVYFIEDMQVARFGHFFSNGVDGKSRTMPDVLSEWQKQLLVGSSNLAHNGGVAWQYPLPKEVLRIDCAAETCAITKR